MHISFRNRKALKIVQMIKYTHQVGLGIGKNTDVFRWLRNATHSQTCRKTALEESRKTLFYFSKKIQKNLLLFGSGVTDPDSYGLDSFQY